jgi:CheY-like chemotaxis protein
MKSNMAADKETDQPVPDPEFRMANPEDRTAQARAPEVERRMPGRILVVVDDLFFLAKIRETAKQAGIELECARPADAPEKLLKSAYSIVVLDLNHRSGLAIETLQNIKRNALTQRIPVLGFLSHVQGDLATAARAAGCDVVMARSAFSGRLPEVLSEYASISKQ